MESLGGDVFESLFVWVRVSDMNTLYVGRLWRAEPPRPHPPIPPVQLSCVPLIHQNIITHQYNSIFILTCLWWLLSGTYEHTQTHMGVYCIFNAQQVLRCHLRVALHKDTNSRLTQTCEAALKGTVFCLVPASSQLPLSSLPTIKGDDTMLPCSTELNKERTKNVRNNYLKTFFLKIWITILSH